VPSCHRLRKNGRQTRQTSRITEIRPADGLTLFFDKNLSRNAQKTEFLQTILSRILVLYRRIATSVTGVRGTHGPRSAVTGVANAIVVIAAVRGCQCNERASAKPSNNNNNNNNRDAYYSVCVLRTYPARPS